MYSRPESAARLLCAALRSHHQTKSPSPEEIRTSLAKAAGASRLRSLMLRLPLLRRAALLGVRPLGELPSDYEWWYQFGYALTRYDPTTAVWVLRAMDRLDVCAEALLMGALAATTPRPRERARGRTRRRATSPVEQAVELATRSLTDVHPAILGELEEALVREFERAGRSLGAIDALNRVGWPAGIVLSVMKRAYERVEDDELSLRSLRDILASVLRNWPSFVWNLLSRLTAGELSRKSQLATLDALIAAGFWTEAAGIIRVTPGLRSEVVAEEAESLGLSLASAAILSTLALESSNPLRRWRLLMKAGYLASKSGKRALAGVLFEEAAETLRPHVDSGAPVLAHYHEALERAALALTDAGLKHRAFRLWAELKLSTAGVRESGIDLPGVTAREARATLWMAELVSEISHREAAGWYLKAARLFEELGAKSMVEYSNKRATLELLFDGKIKEASRLTGRGQVS